MYARIRNKYTADINIEKFVASLTAYKGSAYPMIMERFSHI